MAKRHNLLWLLGVATLLFGCAGLPPAIKLGSLALTGMSYIVTGKGPSDHVISAVANQDCALFRVVEAQPVCIDTQESQHTTYVAKSKASIADSQPRTKQLRLQPVAAVTPRYQRPLNQPQYYLVLGSFSSADNAQRFRQTMPTLRTRVTRNVHLPTGMTQYRVVAGPLAAEDSIRRKQEIARTLRRDVWRLRLCVDSLREPPCANTVTVVASR
ncbi:MAG: SPOR domain-containing protein [Gammaproteobacteria bacterium]